MFLHNIHLFMNVLMTKTTIIISKHRVHQKQMALRCVFFLLFRQGHGGVTALSPLFQGGCGVTGAKSSYAMGEGQGPTWMRRQLIAVPLLMAEAATRGAICTFWGSVCCSSRDSNQQPSITDPPVPSFLPSFLPSSRSRSECYNFCRYLIIHQLWANLTCWNHENRGPPIHPDRGMDTSFTAKSKPHLVDW